MNEIVDIKTAAPSARFKVTDRDDKRPTCKHKGIAVWRKEPIIECTSCGVVVDPYYWIRERCEDWQRARDAEEWKVRALKEEIEELKAALRILRKEYKSEAERRQAEHHLMIMPPRRRL